MPSLQSDPQPAFPSSTTTGGFHRWGFALWLLYYVEDALQQLPLALAAPTIGAVLGTSLAVSEGASVVIEGHRVATIPSFWGVLGPALGGAVGGIVLLALLAAAWGAITYWRDGDSVWEIRLEGANLQLVCKTEVPVDPNLLGAMECIMRRPEGEFERTDMFAPRPGRPIGLLVTGLRVGPDGNAMGGCEVRWYATEHRAHLHEVARHRFDGPG